MHGAADLDEAAHATAPTRQLRRLAFALAGLVAIAAAAVVVLRPVPVPAGTLGHVGVPPGHVADGPLPSGELEIAWEHDPVRAGGPDVSALVTVDGPTVLGDQLVLVDGIVVDMSTGEAIGGLPASPGLVAVGGGEVAILVDGERVTHDVRTGAVVDRVALTGTEDTLRGAYASLPNGALLAQAAAPGVQERSVFVGRDGSVQPAIPSAVIEEVAGDSEGGQFAWQAVRVGPVFVLELFPAVGPMSAAPVAHLVDVATGELLGELPGPLAGATPLVPVGEAVVTVLDGQVLWSMPLDGEVSQLDLGTGEDVAAISLLGAIGDRLVLARRRGSGTWDLLAVPGPPWVSGPAAVTSLGTVEPPPRGQRSSPSTTSPPGIVEVHDATVSGDLVVVLDDHGAAVVARDLTGAERWRRPVADDAMLSSTDDLVLVTEPSSAGTTSTLVDTEGAEVWSDVTSGHPFAPGVRLVDRDVVYTRSSFPLDAVTGETVTDRGPRAPVPGETPIAVVDEPDGIGTGVLATRRVGGVDGTEVLTIGDDVIVELASGEVGGDLFVGIADGVLLVQEFRPASSDRPGEFASMTATSVLIQPDGDRLEVDGTLASGVGRGPAELAGIAVVDRDDGTALLEPGTGRPRFVLPERAALVQAGEDRLVAQHHSGWWMPSGWRVLDATDGTTVGERHDQLVHLLTVGDGVVAAAGVDGSLEVVRTEDGATAWQRDAATIAPSAMAFTGRHLLVGTRDGRVLEHDANGRVLRSTQVGDGPVTSIAAAEGTLVVGVDDVLRGFRTDGDGLTSRDEVRVP